ncbi:isoprenylcysteine carboxylmethyltransferase family protein [Motiliproteus sp. SC1-56]|uniref:methyltransferase family protein n=1 Tax=Motiliproteus sp. SC1-56 TaxID=2799565 RepID=UPI001A903BE8|nr:isoprenylcysteine carboxylmethyltransferase family protein [Motiliproteus sp. SC1-56]
MLQRLELKIPPLLLVLLFAGMMWLAAPLGALPLPLSLRQGLAGLLLVSGATLCVLGVLHFRRARTSVNPLDPGQATTLVSEGVYRLSRNPMYLGFAFSLLAWGLLLGSAAALLLALLFVPCIQRLQILPEERVMAQRFNGAYLAYKRRVRRWL